MILGPEVFLPFFLVFLVALVVWEWRGRKRTIDHAVCIVLFATYLFFVFRFAFLPLILESGFINLMRAGQGPFDEVNLIPSFWSASYGGLTGHQALGNLTLGIPWGFGLMFVARVGPRKVIVTGFLFSLGIECGQALMNLVYGFPYRSIDINDVICNTLGVLIGLGLFFVAGSLFAFAFRDSSIDHRLPHISAVFGHLSGVDPMVTNRRLDEQSI